MKTIKMTARFAAIGIAVFLFVRCTSDTATPVVNYSISGNITYPDFNGTETAAGGAVVYLVKDATEPSTNYDQSTIADASGAYSFKELPTGSYFVFANFDTENTNNLNGRMASIMFRGEGAVVAVADADATQNLALVSAGQADAFSVNTYDGGDWIQDWVHSIVGFEFPYDVQNAPYTGRFATKEIYVNFDPANLAGSKIEATIDLLTVDTDSPGGRDPKYNADGTLWQDPTTLAYKLGCISGTFGITSPEDAARMATFTSTSIVVYGDGYLATGPMVFNGVTSDIQVFFQFIPGFDDATKGFRYSSFKATFEFAALDVYGIESGHVGDSDVTVTASFQVKKAI